MNRAKLSAGVETLFKAALQYPHFKARVERARQAKRWRAAFAKLPLSHAQAAKALGFGSFRFSGLLNGAREPTNEETEQIERFLAGEKIEPLAPRKPPAPPRTAKVGPRSALWSERIARSGLPLTEIARRAGLSEQRGSSILSRSAHLRGDEQQRLERVLGREDEPVRAQKPAAVMMGTSARDEPIRAQKPAAEGVVATGSDSSVGAHFEPTEARADGLACGTIPSRNTPARPKSGGSISPINTPATEPAATPEPLPANWRDALRERGVFITRLARKLGISRCRTRPFLAGKREPSAVEIAVIAELLA